jgi:DNA-binding response OmpR family regulator
MRVDIETATPAPPPLTEVAMSAPPPLTEVATPAPLAIAPPEAPRAVHGSTPLAVVAAAEPALRRALAATAVAAGFETRVAADGCEARDLVARLVPSLVVLDVHLPRLLGVTLCARIKRSEDFGQARVILAGTRFRRDRYPRAPGEVYGADGFIDASDSPEDAAARLKEVLERNAPLPPDVEATAAIELSRLARIVATDILLYNPRTAAEQAARGRFLEAFAAEMREGEALVATRFPHLEDGRGRFRRAVQEAVEQWRLPESMGTPQGWRPA